jgi:hypothetical protein
MNTVLLLRRLRPFGQPRVALSSADRWVRGGLGLLLIGAALLKAAHRGPSESNFGGFPPGALLIGVIAVELVLGLALVLNVAPRATSCGALLLFSAFAAYSLGAALNGRQSCGCFGEVLVAPHITLIIDLVAVSMLLLVRWRWTHVLGASAAFGAMFLFALLSGETGPALGDDDVALEFVEGTLFPAEALVGAPAGLAQNNWKVVFHRPGCAECESLIKRLAVEAAKTRDSALRQRVVLVSVGGAAPQEQAGVALPAALDWKHCSSRAFVATPTLVELRDGRIVSVQQPPSS